MNRKRLLRLLLYTALAFALGALGACNGKVQPQPFKDFHAAVSEVSKSVEATSLATVGDERELLIDDIASGKKNILILHIDESATDDFGWDMESQPLYFSLKRAHAGLKRLNQAFVQYANALQSMANKVYIDKKGLEKLQSDLNGNIQMALEILSSEPSEGVTELITVAATEAMSAYVDNQKEESLKEIIKKTQPHVKTVCDKTRKYIHLLNRRIITKYRDASGNFPAQAIFEAPGTYPPNGKLPRENVEEAVKTVEAAFAASELLQSMDAIYTTLPEAHRDLMQPGNKDTLSSFNDLTRYALRLHAQYEALKKETAERK